MSLCQGDTACALVTDRRQTTGMDPYSRRRICLISRTRWRKTLFI
jgi:hypothetical protein